MRSLGPRARARTRVVRGLEIHEVLVYRGAGPPATSRFATAAEAERQAAIYNAELEAGTLDAPADWQGMIDAFMGERARLRPGTLQTYTHRLQAVAAALEGRDPLTLTTADAAAYWHARERDGVSPTTIAAEMDTIAILQRWCVSKGWCRVATWARAPKPEAQRRESHLRPEQIGAFLRRAEELGREPPGHRVAEDYAYWPAAAWLLMHGLRAGEVQHLLVRDVDLVHGIVHVRDRAGARTKTARSDRGVPILSARALEVLRDALRDRQHELDAQAIPMGREGAAGANGRSKWLARRCALTCELAGIEVLSPHALRHTVATLAITAGADVSSVQALLGHESARVTTRIYSHAVAGAQAMGAARAVGEYLDRAVEARPSIRVVR